MPKRDAIWNSDGVIGRGAGRVPWTEAHRRALADEPSCESPQMCPGFRWLLRESAYLVDILVELSCLG